jgi:hypothetical protein
LKTHFFTIKTMKFESNILYILCTHIPRHTSGLKSKTHLKLYVYGNSSKNINIKPMNKLFDTIKQNLKIV